MTARVSVPTEISWWCKECGSSGKITIDPQPSEDLAEVLEIGLRGAHTAKSAMCMSSTFQILVPVSNPPPNWGVLKGFTE